MSRSRRKVTLYEGESFVVLDVDTWSYLVSVFRELALQHREGTEEADGWNYIADTIAVQYQDNQFTEEFEDEI
jgi:hypothetical protein